MNIDDVVTLTREALYTVVISAAPMLLVSLIVGLAVSIFQTITSIQEQTLTFVPKILAIFATLILIGHWVINNMVDYMVRLWSDFSIYIR